MSSSPAPRGGGRAATGFALGALVGFVGVDLGLHGAVSYRGDPAWLILAAALLGAAAWRPRPLVVGPVLALGLLWCAVAFTPLSAALARGLVRTDPPRPADAVLVMGSRLQVDGEPTTAALVRLSRGLELVAQGLAPRLIVTELPPPSASHAALARASLRRFGLEAEVLSVGPVRNTRDEAVAVGALFRQRGLTRLLLVTSPLHSRRAAAAVEAEGIAVVSSPSVETEFDLENLDWPGERRKAFASALHERIGLWVYARRGWLSPSR